MVSTDFQSPKMNSMMLSAIVVLATMLLVGQAQDLVKAPPAPVECGENQVYGCGSSCVETCTSKPQICPDICKLGCVCKEGYVRECDEPDSPCIAREDCPKDDDPPACGTNEEYNQCGSACVETCTTKPQICPDICKSGCVCKEGYVRECDEPDSPCIAREDCPKDDDPPACGKNEEYNQCGSACPAVCEDVRYPLPKRPKPCARICKPGCFCKKGFYRREDGQCVAPKQCCGNHERYNTCGSACVETCISKPKICTRQCVAGCFCACSDYVRQGNSTGSPCIPRDECPKECEDDDN